MICVMTPVDISVFICRRKFRHQLRKEDSIQNTKGNLRKLIEKRNPKMLRLLFTTIFCIASFKLTECRMGWRGNDNEFMVYSASTNFSSTNSLTITGKLSLRSGAKDKSTIVAVSDANGIYTAEVYAYPSSSAGYVTNVVRKGVGRSGQIPYTNSDQLKVDCMKYDHACDFNVTVLQSRINGTYHHSVFTTISGSKSLVTTTKDQVTWQLDKMELFVGGYVNSKSHISESYFFGCLSNVMFQGVDIIATYFSQYPHNTNPVRGSTVGSPPFATAMQNCNDVMNLTSTVGPTSSTAKITPTKKPGSAASYKASVFILVASFFVTLLSF